LQIIFIEKVKAEIPCQTRVILFAGQLAQNACGGLLVLLSQLHLTRKKQNSIKVYEDYCSIIVKKNCILPYQKLPKE